MKTIREIWKTGRAQDSTKIAGWVRTKRVSKNFAFIVVSDGSCQTPLQAVIDQANPGFGLLDQIQTGASIEITGILKASQGTEQNLELEVEELKLLGGIEAGDYPLQKKGHTLEFLREVGHLRSRTNTFGAMFRLRNTLSFAVHRFFQDRGFIWAQTPILTASDCEGAGQMFQVTTLDLDKIKGPLDYNQDFFGKKTHLTVSGQLEAECLALSHSRVYTFGPTFRAENSNTTRHLSEFWMVEPEVAFADLKSNITLAQDFLLYLIGEALTHCPEELAFFETMYKNTSVKNLEKLSQSRFSQISYTDAVTELKKAKEPFEYPVEWGLDLQTEHERYLCEKVFQGPVAVTDYPEKIKAFYMRINDDGKTVAAMDLLVPGVGELIGGSQREERLDYLLKRMEIFGIPAQDLDWYVDLRRFGSVPHAGFGLGFERLLMYLSGMQNIRDTILCPRAPKLIRF
jgi:asparaginyl-tRNA synthetase